MAAVGQCRLMTLYDSLFEHLRQPIAQILLTRNDIADVRPRYDHYELQLTGRSGRNIKTLRTHSQNFLTWVSFLSLTRMILWLSQYVGVHALDPS